MDIKSVVAPLGTALTEDQLNYLGSILLNQQLCLMVIVQVLEHHINLQLWHYL